MADHVIEHQDNSASMGLILGAILLMLGLLFFFMFGGRSLFNYGGVGTGTGGSGSAPAPQTETNDSGASGGEGGSINVDVPEEINVQTNPGQ